jgi:hypothetical protein
LFIDAKNLLSMLQSSITRISPEARDAFTTMPMLEALGVNNLTSCMAGFSVGLVNHFFLDILPSFPRLKSLALDHFEPVDDRSGSIQGSSVHHSSSELLIPLSLSRLIIKRASDRSVELALRRISPSTLILIRIDFNSPILLPSLSKLVLIDINTDFHRALPKTISRWNGNHLEMRSCPCVDNGFWDTLQQELVSQGDRTLTEILARPILRRFKSLTVIDCPTNVPT